MSFADYAAIRRHDLADVLREHRRSRPGLIAVIDGDRRLTFAELDARVNRLATALAAEGIGRGDHLLWLGQNSSRIYELLLAAAKLGAVLCPANWRMSIAETSRAIADFDPKMVFWQEAEVGDQHRQAQQDCRGDRIWIQHDADGADGYEALLAKGEDRDPELDSSPEAALLAIYTGGFSGRPGAALLNSEAILLQSVLSAHAQAIDERSCYMLSGPMFHIGVLMGGFAAFVMGGTCLFAPRTDTEELLRLIDGERPTHAYVPRPALTRMQELNRQLKLDVSSLFDEPDMSDWPGTMVGPRDAPVLRTPGGYGQTEVMGLSVIAWAGGTGAGRPSPFTAVRIVDDAGEDVPDGATGEIVMRGPMTMLGYHNRDEENTYRTALGWHRTRDLGRRLPDGSIAFVGPKSVLIKTGIENVYPAEVETCLRQHESVADACVIGVPDPQWDQNIKAVVVPKLGCTPNLAELVEHCRANIASYKKPKLLAIVDTLPRTNDGMIDRAAVDAAHGGGGYPSAG